MTLVNQGVKKLNSLTKVARKARTQEVADHFSISKMTLHRWTKQEGFPQPLKRGNIVLYDLEAIDAWLAGEGA